jgi:aspartyl-tRNA(Asn)/glutamyl-tRNA(Gln) amidotransferase subunit A
MSAEDVLYASITDLAPRLARRELSPLELTEACLRRIDDLDSRINAFITVLADSAVEEARRAEEEIQRGSYRGPLHGVPIAHKDLLYTRGIRTTAGSKVLSDFVPEEDAAVVTRLKEAGTVLLGKLNLHEFAAGGTSENPHYGPVHNPWQQDHNPGGSSGGSAAALAAGMCFGTSGTDTAGSIRIPSHSCGTTGIKGTYGRVSCFGVIPLSWSLDHCGPMTRTASDAALMLNVMAGFDRRDFGSVDRPIEDYAAGLDQSIRGLRIGVPTSYFSENLQPEVEAAWRGAIDALVQMGASPVEVKFTTLGDAQRVGMTIVRAEMAAFHREWFARQPDDYTPNAHDRFAQARALGSVEFVQAQRDRVPMRAELWSVFDRVDVLVTPAMPVTAARIGAEAVQVDGRTWDTATHATRFTYPFNISGFPAMTVPCGFDRHGLPIGLQLAAAPWQEALLLRVGHQYQQATDWHTRRPPLEIASAA